MIRSVLLLTKSYKKSPRSIAKQTEGYCVAGIDMNTHRWIRLVAEYNGNTDESLIDLDLYDNNANAVATPFDIIEIDVNRPVPQTPQSENWLISGQPIFVQNDTMETEDVLDTLRNINFEYNEYSLFYNGREYLYQKEINMVNDSLRLFFVTNVKTYRNDFYSRKVSFIYRGVLYRNFSMTDPNYYLNAEIPFAAIALSLPCHPYDVGGVSRYYKFVAKIIPLTREQYFSFAGD